MLSSLTVSKAREGLACYGSVEQAISLSPEVLLLGRNAALPFSSNAVYRQFFSGALKLDVAIVNSFICTRERGEPTGDKRVRARVKPRRLMADEIRQM